MSHNIMSYFAEATVINKQYQIINYSYKMLKAGWAARKLVK